VTTPDEIARRGDLPGSVLRPALREGKVASPELLDEVSRWVRFARGDWVKRVEEIRAWGLTTSARCRTDRMSHHR